MFGLRLTNSRYRGDAQVSELVASRDLKKLCDVGLLTPVGERRGRFYTAAAPLTQIRQASRSPRRIDDPYEIAAKRQKPDDQEEARLPGF